MKILIADELKTENINSYNFKLLLKKNINIRD